MRHLLVLACLPLAGCAALVAKKHTYARGPSARVNGAEVALGVKPEGSAGGSYVLSAMVVSGGVTTLDGPFRWRIEARGVEGKQEAMVVHRLRTTTAVTRRDEWYPPEHLGRRVDFRPVPGEPGRSRAVFEIPGRLEVKPREDGALAVLADVSVRAEGRWHRSQVKFRLDPAEGRQDEFIFLPAEIVRGLTTDIADQESPGWD
jgi:hypothetical protein